MLIIVKECNHGKAKARSSQPNTATIGHLGKGISKAARCIPSAGVATQFHRQAAKAHPAWRVGEMAARGNHCMARAKLSGQSRMGGD